MTTGPATPHDERRPSLRPLMVVLVLLASVWLAALVMIVAKLT